MKLTRRQIDVLIARKIFGWTSLEFTRADGTKFIHFVSRDGADDAIEKYGKDVVEVDDHSDDANAPHFSSYSSESKELRDKLSETFVLCELHAVGKDRRTREYFFYMYRGIPRDGNHAADFWATAKTETLAVALAALKSQGVEVEVVE